MRNIELILQDIEQEGYSYRKYLLDEELKLLLKLFDQADFYQAKVGASYEKKENTALRGDHISWLEDENLPDFFIKEIEALKLKMNQHFFMGLKQHEFHFAKYAPNTFYKKHIDNFRKKNSRVLSLILYLTDHPDHGELVLYREEAEWKRIYPKAGYMMIFLSEDFPHEVKPTTKERKSLTGWIHR